MTSREVKTAARECGFELCGIARALPNSDFDRYLAWVDAGFAGAMSYLADRRAHVRADPRNLLPSARSMICVGKLYNTPANSTGGDEHGRISRYAHGDDYHTMMRDRLFELAERLGTHEFKVCADTAPLLERSYARDAGLGWIGRNTCLIHQSAGSWFFLGELLTSLELEPDAPVANRCGSCTRCIDACPTDALLPGGVLDARRCISYLTIELHGEILEGDRQGVGNHVFGCDICQDVCPWNGRAAMTLEPGFAARAAAFLPLTEMARLSEPEFSRLFAGSPVERARYRGFLRNVAVALGNSRSPGCREALERLREHDDALVASHARSALRRWESETPGSPAES